MILPNNYLERTYAGVLGKMIGVYLGRPFEQWSYDDIMRELGEIHFYVNEKRGVPLIVTDDDLSGTFTFVRALADYEYAPNVTPAQIGQTWLNYIIENRTILWWGGMGNSTEHTAYLRLKNGIQAPRSGSAALNSQLIAEQIGAQIFIDGWAMVAPGDPERAADLANRAASVSHDGEAVYAAQVIAAMESQAYVESDLNTLLNTALSLIPRNSVIQRMIGDIREWHSQYPDWRTTREKIAAQYGYDQWGGNCHVVPNHALIILSLLYGDNNFQKSLMIVNTSGWDTDCNSGNVGCLLGIKNGLAGIDVDADWRGPVADRLYLPTADGGRAITDAVQETYHLVNTGRTLAGLPRLDPKNGSRFHFELPGSVQGFTTHTPETLVLENVAGHSDEGTRSLAMHYKTANGAARTSTPTFIPPDAINMIGYQLHASPTLFTGQTAHLRLCADAMNKGAVSAQIYIEVYQAENKLFRISGPLITLDTGASVDIKWIIPETEGCPIATIGIELTTEVPATSGSLYLDYLTWSGVPNTTFKRPATGGSLWQQTWVNGAHHFDIWFAEAFRISQNSGTGLIMQGGRDWDDYQVTAAIVPHMSAEAGIAARVQGLQRYYALLLCQDQTVRLVKVLDGRTVLAEMPYEWAFERAYDLRLIVSGSRLQARINNQLVFDLEDSARPLLKGGIALVCTEGCMGTNAVSVAPLTTEESI